VPLTTRPCAVAALLLLSLPSAWTQTDRGELTGSVSDPLQAAVPGAVVIAKSLATANQYRTATTETGLYTLPSLPSGDYSLSVEKDGFKKFTQSPIHISVAATLQLDVSLTLGATNESVTVSAESSMLQETSDYSMSMSGERMNDLPLNFATGPGAIRSPFGFLELMPGASNATLDVQQVNGWGIDIRVNGMPNNTFKSLVDGQDTSNPVTAQLGEENQPSNEAIQAFTLQSSNYSAEFGRAGGGVINFTTKSGTNDWHGSAYEYLRNEDLEAGLPYTNDGSGHLVRGRDRQQNFGFSLGGPVWVPKLYNGRNKTFFFVNYEMFRHNEMRYSGLLNDPTVAMRNGDFSGLLTGRTLTTDNAGRPVLEGTIYDYLTDRVQNNVTVRDPFPGNIIPKSRMDPVALAIQGYIPEPKINSLQPINNYSNYTPTRKIMSIPSVKLDEMIGPARISFYFAHERVDKDNGPDGWPAPISVWRYQNIRSNTTRLNYDHTLSATMFNHMGVGLMWYTNPDEQIGKDFDATTLGLKGVLHTGFPLLTLNNVNATSNLVFGTGMTVWNVTKPTAVESLTWVHGSHTFKFGGEWAIEGTVKNAFNGGVGSYIFASSETGYPVSMNLNGGTIGNGYASLLLGYVNNATMGPLGGVGYRRSTWGFFAQDTWRATRKLTVDYGLRYDLQPPQHEAYDRTASFDPSVSNPTVGGIKGGLKFQGYGPNLCNCSFTHMYPWAFGPRIGFAWQAIPKTVIRGGFGVSYARNAAERSDLTLAAGYGLNTLNFSNPGSGRPAFFLQNGIPYTQAQLFANNQSPGLYPVNANAAPAALPVAYVDPNGGRPPRILQWNITLQRELSKDLVVQAAYVGNRAVWLQNDSMVDYNAITPQRLAAFGLDLNNSADRSLLTSQIGSTTAANRGFKAPYVGFPSTSSVAQSLRPFPQFTTINSLWAPLGNSWYDALQVNLQKRMSHGIDASVAYTRSKNLANTYNDLAGSIFINNPFDRRNAKSYSPYDQPQVLAFGFGYQVPVFGLGRSHRWFYNTISGWSLRGSLRYASGILIPVPTAQSNLSAYLFRNTTADRVPGVPLFLHDLNCHCIDPAKQLVLNPAAWVDPPTGQYGTSAPYFNDYRYQRRPKESASLAKTFRVKERYRVDFRAEFFNIFNRTVMPNPTGTNAKLTTLYNSTTGLLSQGFGRIDPNQAQTGTPRTGQLVLRINF
jgi:hypothetical protein